MRGRPPTDDELRRTPATAAAAYANQRGAADGAAHLLVVLHHPVDPSHHVGHGHLPTSSPCTSGFIPANSGSRARQVRAPPPLGSHCVWSWRTFRLPCLVAAAIQYSGAHRVARNAIPECTQSAAANVGLEPTAREFGATDAALHSRAGGAAQAAVQRAKLLACNQARARVLLRISTMRSLGKWRCARAPE